MYKKSNYNIIVDTMENGSKLVFNTMSCVLAIMDLHTQALYEKAEEIDESDMETDKDKETINTMLHTGFILPKNINERDVLKVRDMKQRFLSSSYLLTLTIATSLNCNMACTYCYEGRTSLNKKDMDESVQSDLIDFAKNYIETYKIKALSVVWYGGEPLLNKDAIYNLSDAFISMCEEHEINYSASMVTNGVLLDGETAKKLKEDCKVISAQITLDGMAEYHDTKRIFLDGKGSFDIIVSNIEASKDYLAIGVRVNVDKENMHSVDELKEYFASKGWENSPYVYVSPVRDYGNCGHDYSCILTGDDFAAFETKQIEDGYALNRKNIGFVYPKRKDTFCGALRMNNFVVDPEGYLYTCWHNVGIINQSLGHVKTGYGYNENYTKWLLSTPASKCEECKFLPVCQGGCPFEYMENNEPTCLSFISDYENRLKLAHKDHVQNKEAVNATAV